MYQTDQQPKSYIRGDIRSFATVKASLTAPVQEMRLTKCHRIEAISSNLETWCEAGLVVSIELTGGIFGKASTAGVSAVYHDFEPVLGIDGQAEEAEKGDDVFDGRHVIKPADVSWEGEVVVTSCTRVRTSEDVDPGG